MADGFRRKPAKAAAGDKPSADSQFVDALGRGLNLLNICARHDRPLGNGDLAELSGLPAATVSRLVYTLYRCGYLEFHPREQSYSMGGALVALATATMRKLDVPRVARPLIRRLAEESNFNVGLGTYDGDSMVFVDAVEGPALIGLRLRTGSRIPLVTTAIGRAYLAGMAEPARQRLLEQIRPRFGAEWPMLLAAINQACEDIATVGYCVSAGDWMKDISGVAAPVWSLSGDMLYAINLGGPSYMLSEEMMRNTFGPRLAETARQIRTIDGNDFHE